jgi:hypothetical protein
LPSQIVPLFEGAEELIIMADDGGVDIFVYLGGEQHVPVGVTHVIIDKSVKIIPERAFEGRQLVVSVETHDEIEIVEKQAFQGCISLRGIKLPGVKEVGYSAFNNCRALTDVEFGDKLDTIRSHAFFGCRSIQKITLPFVQAIGSHVFFGSEQLTDVELPDIESFAHYALANCPRLQRIAIPLKENMFPLLPQIQRCTQFDNCYNLATVDIVGGIHNTIASLLIESWKDEMNQEIDRINRVLPNNPSHEKADAIRLWITSVINRMGHYKAEHNTLLKEDMTQLELAVWKAKLDKDEIDAVSLRKERRITSGADINIIISNVLPFLQILE